jgi:exo-1,4-beta-D-glucosaminidase
MRRRLAPRLRHSTIAGLVVLGAVALAASASARTITVGLGGWRVQSSAVAMQAGSEISQPGFGAAQWLSVKPDDAGGVGTEINALVQNGACPRVFFSTNMKDCFGYMNQIGPVTVPRFAVPWWFRTDFEPNLKPGQTAQLVINGVIGQADVWVNGTRVAAQDTVQGAYTQYTFDITRLVRHGHNALALEVFPNDPTAMFTLDSVDWQQIAPDNNTGVQLPIQLHISNALAISGAHVVQSNAPDLSRSALTVKADVTNNATTSQTGIVSATVRSPSGESNAIRLRKSVMLAPGATQTVSFAPADFPQLVIDHPRVWWPYQLGAQPLYSLRMAVSRPHGGRDSTSETFGIRTITTRLVGASPIAPAGSRLFEVNGKPVIFRGGGFSEDLFLRYSAAYTADQISIIKNLGLNGIRTEGKEMPADFYEQMDRAGMLVDSGFQCCDRWQLPDDGAGVSDHDYQVMYLSALAIGKRLRNHPSVINFSWSDNTPIPRQEQVSLQGFKEADFQEPIIASAEYKSTPTLGPSGEKEGPYDWVPPSYWYDTTHYDPADPTRTNAGGSWAFNSEASAGHTVPTLDSIRRFMSPAEQSALWQQPDYNQYHANYEPDLPGPQNGGYSFGTLHDLDRAISSRYGSWSSLGQYVQQAQVQNYETQRAQFEATIDHSINKDAPATGVVYWQLNKGWPTLLWDLYNQDFDQAGSYFGAKKANESLHALYAYDSGTVALDNLTGTTESGLSVESKVYGLDGTLLDEQQLGGVSLGGQEVRTTVLKPKVPATTTSPTPATTFFVELIVRQHDRVVDRNVYWLSTQPDLVNWPATLGNPQATMSQFADLKALQGLAPAKLRVTARTHGEGERGGAVTDVTITNTSQTPSVGFFLRADVRRGSTTGVPAGGDDQVLPIRWSDNDITLWPGESQTLSATYRGSDLNGSAPVVTVSGWNVPTEAVAGR